MMIDKIDMRMQRITYMITATTKKIIKREMKRWKKDLIKDLIGEKWKKSQFI